MVHIVGRPCGHPCWCSLSLQEVFSDVRDDVDIYVGRLSDSKYSPGSQETLCTHLVMYSLAINMTPLYEKRCVNPCWCSLLLAEVSNDLRDVVDTYSEGLSGFLYSPRSKETLWTHVVMFSLAINMIHLSERRCGHLLIVSLCLRFWST